MLGTAIRIAQRMGIDTELANARQPALEAELRRRLWWSLVLFDARISEMTESKTSMLIPTWDCKVPSNVNDFDLRAKSKNPPPIQHQSSEALFVVLRCRIGDCLRRSYSHLDFINPVLKSIGSIAPYHPDTDYIRLGTLESTLDSNLLSLCDPENPLHFMTLWSARVALAKSRFIHHLANCPPNEQQTDEHRDAGLSYARTMLECDTKLMSSSLIKGFRWIIYLHFPFPAYVHLVHDLRKRPFGDHVELGWKVMNDNCSARFLDLEQKDNPTEKIVGHNPFFRIFAGIVLQAWAAREAASGELEEPPLIVTKIRQKLALKDANMQARAAVSESHTPGSKDTHLHTPEPMDFCSFGSLYGVNEVDFTNMDGGPFSIASTQAPSGFNGSQWAWPAPNWGGMPGQGW
jgi:hypothetical protein